MGAARAAADVLGHSPDVLLKTYAHVLPDSMAAVAERIGNRRRSSGTSGSSSPAAQSCGGTGRCYWQTWVVARRALTVEVDEKPLAAANTVAERTGVPADELYERALRDVLALRLRRPDEGARRRPGGLR